MTAAPHRMLDTTMRAEVVIGPDVAGPPARARTVVVGGGILGAATAWGLARGGDDVVLLERHDIAAGTTWHAAGLLARVRGAAALSDLADAAYGIHRDLESLTGLPVGFTRNGSLTLARTTGRVDEITRVADHAAARGVPAELLDVDGALARHPRLRRHGIIAALWQPDDAMVNPGWAAAALWSLAYRAGARLHIGVDVRAVVADRGRVVGVAVGDRVLACERVVLCAGLWTRDLAATAGGVVPLYAAEHVHVTSGPIAGVTADVPLLRDLDHSLYVRPHNDAFVVGAFEPAGRPRAVHDVVGPYAEFPTDDGHDAPVLDAARRSLPDLVAAGWARRLTAPESFTPDVGMCLGPVPEVEGLWVGAGMNSQGIIYGPSAGEALAQWMIQGSPQFDAAAVDVGRFGAGQANRAYLHERTRESLGRLYAMHWPHWHSDAARGVRRTPLTSRFEALGAVLGETVGWERPLFFAREPAERDPGWSFRAPAWWGPSSREHRAARDGVAVVDLSTFGTVEVHGPGVAAVVGDVAVGRCRYVLLLNAGGGIDTDATVMRHGADHATVVLPTARARIGLAAVRRLACGADVAVVDSTAGTATLLVAGPLAADLLARIIPASTDLSFLPRFGLRDSEIAMGHGTVARVSFTGGPGYELHLPVDVASGVLDALLHDGDDLGIVPAGLFALDSLRSEVGYRHAGEDMGPADSPVAVGLSGVRTLGGPVVAGHRSLVHVALDSPDVAMWHGEPVLLDGRPVGRVTSAAYGWTLDRSVGLAWVDPLVVADVDPSSSTAVEVLVTGVRHRAELSLSPFLTPTG